MFSLKNIFGGRRRRKKTRKNKKKEGSAAEKARKKAESEYRRARQKSINKEARKQARLSYINAIPYYNKDGDFNSARHQMIENIRRLEGDIDIREKARSDARKASRKRSRKQSLNKMVSVGNFFEGSKKSKKKTVKRPTLITPARLITVDDLDLGKVMTPPASAYASSSVYQDQDEGDVIVNNRATALSKPLSRYLDRLERRKEIPGASIYFENPRYPDENYVLPLNHPDVPNYKRKFGPGKVRLHPGTMFVPATGPGQGGPTYSPLEYPRTGPPPPSHNPYGKVTKTEKKFFKLISENPNRFELDGKIYDENFEELSFFM